METFLEPAPGAALKTKCSLKNLINQLLYDFKPTALKQQTAILNKVSDIRVNADEQLLATVIGSLFCSMLTSNKCGSIRFTSKSYNDIVFIHIMDVNRVNHRPLLTQLERLQPLARKLGGCITRNWQRNDSTMVTFSFFNPVKATE